MVVMWKKKKCSDFINTVKLVFRPGVVKRMDIEEDIKNKEQTLNNMSSIIAQSLSMIDNKFQQHFLLLFKYWTFSSVG